jgi:riboflavin biosynthesis pyrimidine reductase
MSDRVSQLYPTYKKNIELKNLYLKHKICKASRNSPFFYANFITSLDGRIAIKQTEKHYYELPKSLENAHDFRLFLELHAQADCLITHSGYLRALEKGTLGNILQVGLQNGHEDLTSWRNQQGLKAQPDIIILSRSLNFNLPKTIKNYDQHTTIITGKSADKSKINHFQKLGYEVIETNSSGLISPTDVFNVAKKYNYKYLYLVTGPAFFQSMLKSKLLNRLYITINHKIIGGKDFMTITSGLEAGLNLKLKLLKMYHQEPNKVNQGQWFAEFDVQ